MWCLRAAAENLHQLWWQISVPWADHLMLIKNLKKATHDKNWVGQKNVITYLYIVVAMVTGHIYGQLSRFTQRKKAQSYHLTSSWSLKVEQQSCSENYTKVLHQELHQWGPDDDSSETSTLPVKVRTWRRDSRQLSWIDESQMTTGMFYSAAFFVKIASSFTLSKATISQVRIL